MHALGRHSGQHGSCWSNLDSKCNSHSNDEVGWQAIPSEMCSKQPITQMQSNGHQVPEKLPFSSLKVSPFLPQTELWHGKDMDTYFPHAFSQRWVCLSDKLRICLWDCEHTLVPSDMEDMGHRQKRPMLSSRKATLIPCLCQYHSATLLRVGWRGRNITTPTRRTCRKKWSLFWPSRTSPQWESDQDLNRKQHRQTSHRVKFISFQPQHTDLKTRWLPLASCMSCISGSWLATSQEVCYLVTSKSLAHFPHESGDSLHIKSFSAHIPGVPQFPNMAILF